MKTVSLILIHSLLVFSSICSAFADDGMFEWRWGQSKCDQCGIYFQVQSNHEFDDRVLVFKRTLEDEKQRILEIYQSDPQEYNLLAWMALGILGKESRFYESGRYKIKEAFPWMVTGAKIIKSSIKGGAVSENSRGPTQIKIVPDIIAYYYKISSKDLDNPKAAAVATMGFLIESLHELKNRARNNKLTHINENTYVDYLPYIYFGRAKALIDRTATPEKNIYVQQMKKNMALFVPFEHL